MGGLFGRPQQPNNNNNNNNKAKSITSQDRAILKLKAQRDKLEIYIKKLEVVIDEEKKGAVKLAKGDGLTSSDSNNSSSSSRARDREKALLLLKRSKLHSSYLLQSRSTLHSIHQLIDNIEFAQVEAKVFEQLKAGASILEQLNSQIDVDDVYKLMDDTAEAIEYQQEVSNALAGQLTEDDEDELEAQLDLFAKELEAETSNKEDSKQQEEVEVNKINEHNDDDNVDLSSQLPNAPTHDLPTATSTTSDNSSENVTIDQLPDAPDTPLPTVVATTAKTSANNTEQKTDKMVAA